MRMQRAQRCFAIASFALTIPGTGQAEEFKPLSLKADSEERFLEVAVGTAFVEEKAEPLIAEKLNENEDLRDATIELEIGSAESSALPIHAEASAEWRYVKGILGEQWTDVDCTFEAVLQLTSDTVNTARIEISNPEGIARKCKAHGTVAELLGDEGVKALTAVVNHQLGTRPVSEPVLEFLNKEEAKEALSRYVGIDTLDELTKIAMKGCQKKNQAAICVTLDAP
jgi:hypothetical protein